MKELLKKTVLDNGVRIITTNMPHLRSVSMGVWVNAGARDESVQQNGLSHLVEHMIFKGTKKRSAFDIAKEFDSIGGHTNAFTSFETTCYHAKVMDIHLNSMVQILSDIFLNSVFDSGEVERELPVILQEINIMEDSPEDHIHLLSSKNFWGNHPLGRSIIGTKENVMSFDADTIEEFFHLFYQPDRIVISAAGNIDHDDFCKLAAKGFEHIKAGVGFPERTEPKQRSQIQTHRKDLEQAHICICMNGPSNTSPDSYVFNIMNTIIGGNMSSRLFQEIREQKSLAYSVYSFLMSYVDTGMFGIYAGVAPETTNQTIDLILEHVRKLKKARVSASELEAAKQYAKSGIMLEAESNDNQMMRAAQSEIDFNRHVHISEVIDQIDHVTEGQILELAQNIFDSHELSLTLLGPVPDEKAFEGLLL